jgi:hypothetical protein
MVTHYDVIGVVPGDPPYTIAAKYKAEVLACLPEEFAACTGMKHRQSIQRIQALSEAFNVLSHSDLRKAYNKKLMAQALVCSLCEGRGFVMQGFQIKCAACGGTGKGCPPPPDVSFT